MIGSESMGVICRALAGQMARAALCVDGIWKETPLSSVKSTSGAVSVVVELAGEQASGSTVTGLRLMDESGNIITQVTTAISRAQGDENGYSLQYTLTVSATRQA